MSVYGDSLRPCIDDIGGVSYRYSAFGELTLQIDAKNQFSEQDYDVLGLLVKRLDRVSLDGAIEHETRWHYEIGDGGVKK